MIPGEFVRALSVWGPDNADVESAGSEVDTPVPPRALVRQVKELRALLAELSELSGAGELWGVRTLQRQLELALASPTTLADARNQVDFVVTLLDAVWEAMESGFGGLRVGPTREETGRRQERLEALRERLDNLSDHLAALVEAWERHHLGPS